MEDFRDAAAAASAAAGAAAAAADLSVAVMGTHV